MYDVADYHEAANLPEALDFLAANPGWRVIAGGTDLLIKMRHGKIKRALLLGIGRIESMRAIHRYADDSIGIGALASFKTIAADPLIRENVLVLAEGADSVGGPQVRAVATIGGNICNGMPSADSAPALFALGARLKLQSKESERTIPIEQFYLGPGRVDLKPGEILTEILLAADNFRGFGGSYIKFAMRKAMDIATLGVAVCCRLDHGAGVIADLRIGLGVAAPTPIRCPEAEAFARGKAPSAGVIAAAGRLVLESMQARTSWRASREYREHLAEELTQRAFKTALVRAGGETIA